MSNVAASSTPPKQPTIRLKTDRTSPAGSSLPLPSWASLTGSGKGKTVSAESPISYFKKDDTASQRFGDLVNASIGNLERSQWRRGLRFLRPFSSANENTATAAFRWLFTDETVTNRADETDVEEQDYIDEQALLSTSEVTMTGLLPRRQSVSANIYESPRRHQKARPSSLAPPVSPARSRKPRAPQQPHGHPHSWRKWLGISRFAAGLLCFLLLLGLREVYRGNATEKKHVPTLEVHTSRWTYSPRVLLRSLRLPLPPKGKRRVVPPSQIQTTAILLTYRRRSNVIVALTHLCHFLDDIFREIIVWNNDPTHHYRAQDLGATDCPSDRIRFINSPDNFLFVARYLACAQAFTPYCYFQDDDFLVWPLRAMHAQFMRDPEGPLLVSASATAGKTTSTELYSWKWCFFQLPSVHTCFAWVGAGSFVSRAKVVEYMRSGVTLQTRTLKAMSSDEVGMADNAFSTLLNDAPYVLAHPQIALQAESSKAFSRGSEGHIRNQQYIASGLQRMLRHPEVTQDRQMLSPQADFHATVSPPLAPHPHAHHSRAPCASDTCLFITNVNTMPSPTLQPLYKNAASNFSLPLWEARGDEQYTELMRWGADHPYAAAVDHDLTTVWRSSDIIRRGDYVGLMLVDPLETSEGAEHVMLNLAMEDIEDVLAGGLDIEISSDGYRWLKIPSSNIEWACKSLPERSRPPSHPFPDSPLLSPLAARLRGAESAWRSRRTERIRSCSVPVTKAMFRRPADESEGAPPGWRFIRVVFSAKEGSVAVGWAIFEIGLTEE